PRIWCVLAADLERANRHVIESVVRPALGTAQPLGVLLAGNLLRGRRSEVNMREHAGAELWSGLRTMQAELSGCVIEQCILPMAGKEFFATLMHAAKASVRIAARVALQSPQLRRGDLIFDLSQRTVQLAKLIAMDVMRAHQADRAMRGLI